MSGKAIYKMSIKILQLCLVLVSTFKELVEFSLSSAAQFFKIAVTSKTLVETNILTVTFCCDYNIKNDIPLLIGTNLFDLKIPI